MAYRNYSTANGFIVSSDGTGDFTTIASALTAASSGDTIFIRDGTYTENLTLKAGVNLTNFGSGSSLNGTGRVIINGTCTFTAAGTVTISGIQLQTNSAELLAVTGSAASVVNLQNCFINCTNNTGITYSSSSSSSSINLYSCNGNLTTTGIAYFSHSSAGILFINYSKLINTGLATTANTISSGALFVIKSDLDSPISSSSTSSVTLAYSTFNTAAQNSTSLTINGSGPNSAIFCQFFSGTATAVTATSTINEFRGCFISSSNTNAVDGAGTLNYSDLTFAQGASVKISTTTQNGGVLQGGVTQAPSAGFIGERITASATPAITSTVIANITSISLTAGVWDISAIGTVLPTTSVTVINLAISANTASFTGTVTGDSLAQYNSTATSVAQTMSIPAFRVTLTTTTTYYLVVQATFTGTATANGRISGTRVG